MSGAFRASDLLSVEASARIERWSEKDRRAAIELLKLAGSEVQRELLRRAIAAGHELEPLRDFARAIFRMPDAELVAACTSRPEQVGVEAALRASGDPLFAFSLRQSAGGEKAPTLPLAEAPAARRPSSRRAVPLLAAAQGALNAVIGTVGLEFRIHELDGTGLSVSDALDLLQEDCQRGVIVPAFAGARAGDFRACLLVLQVHVGAKSRSYQLYEPASGQVAWVPEQQLLMRAGLPLSDPSLTRLTAIAVIREEEEP